MSNSKYQISNAKIALAHDSFTQMGGAERIMDSLHELFPDAPVFTLVFDERFKKKYQGWDIRASWLQKIYNFHPHFKHLLPFIPAAVNSLNFEEFDMVISSSSAFVKNICPPKNCTHINYCNTPARFLWIDKDYVSQETPWAFRPLIKLFLIWMRRWDLKGSERVNYFIANSKEVQKRIFDVYFSTSLPAVALAKAGTVIYPPVDVDFWKPVQSSPPFQGGVPREAGGGGEKDVVKRDFFLLAGRLQAHKRNALMIEIFNELGLPLHVVGTGRHEQFLRSIAKSNITFLGRISDEQLRDEYSGALGFIYPQLEDFGLMPLEAAACGTATLAYGKGGALETVIPGVTGEFFGLDVVQAIGLQEKQATGLHYKDQIKQLILNWNPRKYKVDSLRAQAEKFSKEKFKQEILEFIESLKK